MPPRQKQIVEFALATGLREFTSMEVASHCRMTVKRASGILRDCDRAGVVNLIEQRKHGWTRLNVYELAGEWRKS